MCTDGTMNTLITYTALGVWGAKRTTVLTQGFPVCCALRQLVNCLALNLIPLWLMVMAAHRDMLVCCIPMCAYFHQPYVFLNETLHAWTYSITTDPCGGPVV